METPKSVGEYFVLKNGEILGPFSADALRTGMQEGKYAGHDLVQTGELPLWQSLASVLTQVPGKVPGMSGTIIPEWQSIARLAALRLRHNLRENSLKSAIFCLLAAVVIAAVSHWTFVFWVPWLLVAIAAGAMLIARRREFIGTLVILAVVAIPFGKAYVDARSLQSDKKTAQASPKASVGERWIAKWAPAFDKAISDTLRSAVAKVPTDPATAEPGLQPPAVPVTTLASRSVDNPVSFSPAAGVVNPAPAPLAKGPSATPVPPWERPPAEWEKSPSPLGLDPAGPKEIRPDFVQGHTDAFVIVKGTEGSGSGFICRAGNQTWLYTNVHVVAEMERPVFTRLGNAVVVPGMAEAAAGPDIVRYAMPAAAGNPLELMTEVDSQVRIGDEVVVLGNSGGGGVVTSLPGEIQGIGPDRLEVTSAFIPGNSGSPIIHVKTGKVIGIATYLTRRYEEFAPKSESTPPSTTPPRNGPADPRGGAMVVRRFGYRIDTVTRWEPINWPIFRGEAKQIQNVSALTADIVGFLGSLRARSAPRCSTETLRRPAMDWLDRVRTKKLSESDRLGATQRFLGQLRSMVRGDVSAAEASLRYTYFRNALKDEREVRDQLYQVFDRESTSLSSPTGRSGY